MRNYFYTNYKITLITHNKLSLSPLVKSQTKPNEETTDAQEVRETTVSDISIGPTVTAMVLYDGANNFYGRYSNIETGEGGFTCEFSQMHSKISYRSKCGTKFQCL